ncbi:MAG: saccharopine dehydrogenase family protein [Planctomycetota bacterium]
MTDAGSAVVLGAGMVGAAMARDLARDGAFNVLAVDVDPAVLALLEGRPGITTSQADLGAPAAIRGVIEGADLVLGALPSVLGLQALQTVIEAGKPYCDISFMPEDGTRLDGLAREHGVTAVMDCGVAPGLANMIIGHCVSALDRTDDVIFYVGGLPLEPAWPFLYKAPFAPADVLEEYTRPARFVEDGVLITKAALSDAELIEFEGVGTLEAFNTDGLRSLLKLPVPNIKEKTLRWPGHIELMRVFRETGFFAKEEIEVGGARVRPLDVTSRLMFPHWKLAPGEREFTLLTVHVKGTKDGRPASFDYRLYDEYDEATDEASMSRTTGYPCTIVARMLADGRFDRPGVHSPEALGAEPGVLDHVITELARRGVVVERR